MLKEISISVSDIPRLKTIDNILDKYSLDSFWGGSVKEKNTIKDYTIEEEVIFTKLFDEWCDIILSLINRREVENDIIEILVKEYKCSAWTYPDFFLNGIVEDFLNIRDVGVLREFLNNGSTISELNKEIIKKLEMKWNESN